MKDLKDVNGARLLYIFAIVYIIVMNGAFVLLSFFSKNMVLNIALCVIFMAISIAPKFFVVKERDLKSSSKIRMIWMLTIYVVVSIISVAAYAALTLLVYQDAYIPMAAVALSYMVLFRTITKKTGARIS